MKKKSNSSYASWALIMEGVTSARVEAYRLRHLLNRTLQLVEKSAAKDHLYQVGGDIISGFPQRLHRLEETLDRTSYALAKMGQSHLKERLPLSDREKVEESIERAMPLSPSMRKAYDNVVRIASRKEFFDVLAPIYKKHAKDPRWQTVLLQIIKFWFMSPQLNFQSKKMRETDEKWFARTLKVTGDTDLDRSMKQTEGYGKGDLAIGAGVRIVFTDHAVVRCALRNVTLNQAAGVVKKSLLKLSQNPSLLEEGSHFARNFNQGLEASSDGIEVRYTVSSFKVRTWNSKAVIQSRSDIIVHTVIRNGQVESAGSLDLSKWFDPTLMGFSSWDVVDWNKVKNR